MKITWPSSFPGRSFVASVAAMIFGVSTIYADNGAVGVAFPVGDVRIDGGGWENSGQDRSHRFTGVGAGSHTVQVRAVNLGSSSPGAAASDSFGVQNEPKVVTLRKGATLGYYNGQYGYCNATCWHYDVTVTGFPDGAASGYAYCSGTRLSTNIRIDVRNGTGSYSGKFPEAWCGNADAWVVIDGIRSNNW